MADESSPRMEEEMGEMVANERSITLHLSKYPDWVRSLTDEELEKVFEIGVVVKESIVMTVKSNKKQLEEVLASQLGLQMKPVQETMTTIRDQVSKKVQEIERNVTKSVSENILNITAAVNEFKQDVSGGLTNIKTDLVTSVSGVADKVKPLDSLNTKIEKSRDKILKEMRELDKSVQALGKPNTKGIIGERTVLDILKEGLPKNFTVQNTATVGSSGDLLVTTVEGKELLIEVKNHEHAIAKQQIEKFEKVVENHPKAKVGIMFSLRSGIAKRSKRGKFEIYSDKNKYFIYVPNAIKEEDLIVWSVMLANELAEMNDELKDSQKSTLLNTLYGRFKDRIENAKNSRLNLQSLEATVNNLKENIEPILDILEVSQAEIYNILH